MLNLMLCQTKINQLFTEKLNLDVDYEMHQNPNYLHVTNDITIDGYNGDIQIDIHAFDNGMLLVDFIFDKLFIGESSLILLNKFNENCWHFSAFIDEDTSNLNLRFFVPEVDTEEKIAQYIDTAFTSILSDAMEENLKPLTDLIM